VVVKVVTGRAGDFFAPIGGRSKKVRLGFVVVNTRTGEELSDRFRRRASARKISESLAAEGIPSGVRTLTETVPA